MGRDDGAPRAGAARFHSSERAARHAVGRPARAPRPRDARRHPRPARPGRRGARARRVRATGHAGLASAAGAGLPHRPDRRQHAHRRGGVHHGDHRLRRHEPHRADHRPRVGARFRVRRPRRRRAVPRRAAGCSTAISAVSCSRTSSSTSLGVAWAARSAHHDRDQLLARRPRPRGAGVRRALQRDLPADARHDGVGRLGRLARSSAPPVRDSPTRRWRPAAPPPSAPRSTRCSTPSRSRSLRAEGVWITDTAGRTYLDAYNNVPVRRPRAPTGDGRDRAPEPPHQHPHALPAPERDRARGAAGGDLPAGARHGACSSTPARRPTTSRGAWPPRSPAAAAGSAPRIAYHGITEAIAALSPEGWFGAPGPDHVETWEPRSALAPAIERLRRARVRAGGHDPRRRDHQRRHRRPRAGVRPGARPADPRGRRAVDRR